MDANTTTIICLFALSVILTGYTAFRLGRQWKNLQRTLPQVFIAFAAVALLAFVAAPFAAKSAALIVGWVFAMLVIAAWTFLVGAISKGNKS